MLSAISRTLSTPLSDLLRGRITGPIPKPIRIAQPDPILIAELPNEIKSLLQDVVRQTRLWKREKRNLAIELVAHFTDGLAAGASADELIEHFGDPAITAKLIRRSQIRNRSLLWKARRWIRRGVLLLIAFYSLLAIYFYSGHARPTVNYIASINEAVERTPPNQRAWPVYSAALLSLKGPAMDDAFRYSVDGKHWPQIATWIAQKQDAIGSIRAATTLPALGYVLGTGDSSQAAVLFPVPPQTDSLVSVLLPHLNWLRSLANLLNADCKLAAQQHDSSRCVADLQAILNLGEQTHREAHLLIGDLVSVGIIAIAYDRLDQLLAGDPQIFSDSQLIDLAHRLARPQTASDLMSFRGEQLLFRDIVQRVFTDDGHGDGRIASGGLRALNQSMVVQSGKPASVSILESIFQPACLLIGASRRSVLDADDRIMNLAEDSLHHPLREVDSQAIPREMEKIQAADRTKLQSMLLKILIPSLDRARVTPERLLGQRDGLEVGIALEFYRRQHGHFPDSLAQLVPSLLPEVPADRITGDPVKYHVINGQPLVYSVGEDRQDDGGESPIVRGRRMPWIAGEWFDRGPIVHGDWILYPQPHDPPEDDDD